MARLCPHQEAPEIVSDELIAQFEAAPAEHRPEILRAITDPIAAAHFVAQRHGTMWLPRFDLSIPELAACALVLMVKDENDIIRQNLEHHYNLGFRRFFVMDNSSTDGTSDRIAAFRVAHSEALVFYAYDQIVGYHQQTKMNAFQVFAQSYLVHEKPQLDWIFFVDADEFITCCSADIGQARDAFQGALADIDQKIMIFHWVQCASKAPIQALQGGYKPQDVFRHRWHKLDPAVPKVSFRSNHGIMTTQGNHTTTAYPYSVSQAKIMAEAGFYLLHYPMRSIEQLYQKIMNGGRAYQGIGSLSEFGGHWKTYYSWLQQSGKPVLLHLLRRHIKSCN
jgi:Glycosyl transferase family 2